MPSRRCTMVNNMSHLLAYSLSLVDDKSGKGSQDALFQSLPSNSHYLSQQRLYLASAIFEYMRTMKRK